MVSILPIYYVESKQAFVFWRRRTGLNAPSGIVQTAQTDGSEGIGKAGPQRACSG